MTLSHEVRKGPKESESDRNGPPVRSEKSESPYRTRTSDRAIQTGPKVSDLLLAAFGGKGSWTWWQVGDRQSGPLPPFTDKIPWRDDLTHTAAEMGPGPEVNPTAFALDRPALPKSKRVSKRDTSMSQKDKAKQ